MAYMLPEIFPEDCASAIDSRIAKGEAVPSKVTGMINKTITTVKEPNNAPRASVSNAWLANRRIGLEATGINPTASDAQASIL